MNLLRAAAQNLPVMLRDGAGVVGAGLIIFGASLVYRPAGFLVAGAFLLFVAWRLGRAAD